MKTAFTDAFEGCSKSGPLDLDQKILCYNVAELLQKYLLANSEYVRIYYRDDIYGYAIVFYCYTDDSPDGIMVVYNFEKYILRHGLKAWAFDKDTSQTDGVAIVRELFEGTGYFGFGASHPSD